MLVNERLARGDVWLVHDKNYACKICVIDGNSLSCTIAQIVNDQRRYEGSVVKMNGFPYMTPPTASFFDRITHVILLERSWTSRLLIVLMWSAKVRSLSSLITSLTLLQGVTSPYSESEKSSSSMAETTTSISLARLVSSTLKKLLRI